MRESERLTQIDAELLSSIRKEDHYKENMILKLSIHVILIFGMVDKISGKKILKPFAYLEKTSTYSIKM